MLNLSAITEALAATFGRTTAFTVYTEGNTLVMNINGVTAHIHNWQTVSLSEIVSTARGIKLNESVDRRVLLNG